MNIIYNLAKTLDLGESKTASPNYTKKSSSSPAKEKHHHHHKHHQSTTKNPRSLLNWARNRWELNSIESNDSAFYESNEPNKLTCADLTAMTSAASAIPLVSTSSSLPYNGSKATFMSCDSTSESRRTSSFLPPSMKPIKGFELEKEIM
jgi:hypothetical protein